LIISGRQSIRRVLPSTKMPVLEARKNSLLQRMADQLFGLALAINARGVEMVIAQIERPVEQLHRIVIGHRRRIGPADIHAAKPHGIDRAAVDHSLHTCHS
jgi:hypothetical protein